MTIRKGDAWGEPAACPANVEVVGTDRDLRDWVVWHRTRNMPIPDIGVSGGDLARTCGGATGTHPQSAKVTIDAMRLELDGHEPTWGVAHAVVRRAWLRDEVVMVMNAQFYGHYDIAPRSHPNDGKVDVLRVGAAMGWRERLVARSRARVGAHLPHPFLVMKSVTDVEIELDKSMVVWVDGARCGVARNVRVTVEPDAFSVYV
jgi:diacylglycerol kinase family enzyme